MARPREGRGTSTRLRSVGKTLQAGAILLIALRASIAGASIWALYVLLSLSLPAHAFDLIRRLRRTE